MLVIIILCTIYAPHNMTWKVVLKNAFFSVIYYWSHRQMAASTVFFHQRHHRHRHRWQWRRQTFFAMLGFCCNWHIFHWKTSCGYHYLSFTFSIGRVFSLTFSDQKLWSKVAFELYIKIPASKIQTKSLNRVYHQHFRSRCCNKSATEQNK